MLRNSHLQPHRLAHSPTRLRLALVAGAALACTLFAGPISAAPKHSRHPRRRSVSNSPSRPKRP